MEFKVGDIIMKKFNPKRWCTYQVIKVLPKTYATKITGGWEWMNDEHYDNDLQISCTCKYCLDKDKQYMMPGKGLYDKTTYISKSDKKIEKYNGEGIPLEYIEWIEHYYK